MPNNSPISVGPIVPRHLIYYKACSLVWRVMLFASMLLPYILVLAVNTSSLTGRASILPDAPSQFSHDMYARTSLLAYFANTMVVSAATVFVTVCLSILANFTFSRPTLAVLTALMSVTLLVHIFSPVETILPTHGLMSFEGLLYTYMSQILIYVTVTLPLAIWILNGFRGKLAIWLEEAASIDGANPARVFWDITLPVSRPGTLAVFAHLVIVTWQEFLFSLTFKKSNLMHTHPPPPLWDINAPIGSTYTDILSASIVISLPVVAVFMYFKPYLVAGLNKGLLEKG